MKKIVVFVGMLMACVLLSGCNDDPKKVVSEFAKAVKSNDYQKAAACIEDTTPADFETKFKDSPEKMKAFASMKPLSADVNGNEAVVKTQILVEVNLKVKKINGNWQISDTDLR